MAEDSLAHVLAKQLDTKAWEKNRAKTMDILTLIGCGVFLGATVAFPALPMVVAPFLKNTNERYPWKRFNIPYLKRTLDRLERQKLCETKTDEDILTIEITSSGKKRLLKYALDTLTVEKPRSWDGTWRLVSYDIPRQHRHSRDTFRNFLNKWHFFPLQESVHLHAYPCGKQIEYLREYLGIGRYVRLFRVSYIENDTIFRDYFGV